MDDCGDNSDEEHCGCQPDQFSCSDGNCIPGSWECDNWDDCGDNSDEEHCDKSTDVPPVDNQCSTNDFHCDNGLCIISEWECDYYDDCGDNSDEANCESTDVPPVDNQCSANDFHCDNGLCIIGEWECDDYDDCGDNSDEAHCESTDVPPVDNQCSADEFHCDNGLCIIGEWECDDYDDCGDNSDEANCSSSTDGCQPDEFTCANGNCIPDNWECDDMDDCGDNSDEEQCDGCLSNDYICANGDCIRASWECDDENDCGDNSDEAHCGGFSHWSEWTDCNVECGTGEQSRTRNCELLTGCEGETTQYRLCHMKPCFPEATSGCGTRQAIAEPRIVGGEDAKRGAWPWTAQLYYEGYGSVVCGGTLIGPRHVVSAAHCFEGEMGRAKSWKVILGKHTLSGSNSDQTVVVSLNAVHVHESYNSRYSLDHDIVLLELSEDVMPSDMINYACVDEAGETHFNGHSYCFISGWGTIHEGGNSADILQEAMVPLLSRDLCNAASSYNGSVTENMLCAGYFGGNIDACQGDSGGPLVCIDQDEDTGTGRWYLTGITSWGNGCARNNFPGIYTLFANYVDWIKRFGAL